VEDILNALVMIVTYRGHVNRFLVSAASRPPGDPVADKTMIAEILVVMAALMVAAVGQWIGFDQTAPFFQAFDWQTKHEWINRTTASVVTSLIVGLAVLQGSASRWGMALTTAYFLHDLGHTLLYDSDIANYVHHVVSLAITLLMKFVMTPEQAETVTTAAAILESTNPFVNLSWLLKRAGYNDRPWFKYAAGGMVAVFGIMRVVIFPWFLATKMDRGLMMLFAPIAALNVFWFWKILRLVEKVLRPTPDGKPIE
jgi:hypothetical protein